MTATSTSIAPNLLDLVELASVANVDIAGAMSVCADDGPDPRPPQISVCADDGKPDQIEFSICADDGKPGSGQIGICDDDVNPNRSPSFSVCADDTDTLLPSDVRLKTDIQQVGSTVYGLPLYHFRYTDGEERFEGVMAQDVFEVMPEAVSIGSNGFYRVDYRKLGIEMTRV